MNRKTHKILSAILSAVMLISVFSTALPQGISVQAETNDASFTYSLSGDKAVITGYTGTDSQVTVPDTIDGYAVSQIGEFAFFMNTNITEITLPETIEVIDDYAFFKCSKLSKVSIEKNSTLRIGTSAFEGCISLREIVLPDTVTEIGERAFLSCSNLDTVETGKTVDKIGAYAFGFVRNTATWYYDKYFLTVKGYDNTAIEEYCIENGVDYQSLGQGNPAPADSGKLPEEELDIPVLNFTDYNNYGDADDTTLNIRDVIGRNTKDYTANATATYSDPKTGLEFDVYANLKLQGNSSMTYPKKNFTIKLYEDNLFDGKYKVEMQDGWGKENKYVLKANYMDHSHTRNVLGAKLWGQIVDSRESTYQQLLDAPNGGAIDGFPVKVYINGKYEGLYTFNIPKDDWQFAMGDGEKEALLGGESHEGSCNFTQPGIYNGSDWTIEYPDPEEENVEWVKTSFDNVIDFVSNRSDEEFKNMFTDYLDYDSCIDYYVYMLFICGTDNWEKNMLMATYDGQQWFPSVYDMDSTFGIYWNGSHYNTIDWMLTHEYKGPDHGTNSLLWERVYNNFYDDIAARYAELRNTVLSEKNFIKTLNDFIGDIPKEVFDRDLEIYNRIPSSNTSDPNQIINYTLERIKYLDEQFGYDNGQPDNPLKESLKEKLDEAKLIDTSEYTAVSSAYFSQELKFASEIYTSKLSTDEEIISATESLSDALNKLIPIGRENISLDLAKIPQSNLTADAPNYHNGDNPSNALDGNADTMWHTYWNSSEGEMPVISENGKDNYITITINDENTANVAAVSYLPRNGENVNGVITSYKIKYSTDDTGENFIDVPGGSGIWQGNKDEKLCIFDVPVEAKRIRLYATSTLGDKADLYISAAEINLFTTDTTALNSAVKAAQEIKENIYTVKSFNEMREKLDSALATLSVSTSQQKDINTVCEELNTAIDNLKYYLGDVDHNGKITVTDATLVQIYLAKLPYGTVDQITADTDSDGNVTVNDATNIQKLAVKILSNNDDGSINF